MELGTFERAFDKASAPVQRWLTLRTSLMGLAAGLVVGAAVAATAWRLRSPEAVRIACAAGCAVVGGALGWWIARRNALSRVEMALYLDRVLDGGEAVATAVDIDPESAAAPAVIDSAAKVIERATTRRTRPRVFAWAHLAAPLAIGAVVALLVVPPPPAPLPPPSVPGADVVTLEDTKAIDRVIEELEKTKARDAEQQKRLDDLTEQAKKLREKAKNGAPRREIQAEIAELAEGLAAEQQELGEGDERRGLEAAMNKLEQARMNEARKALGDKDMEALDEAMERAARSADEHERQSTKEALQKAAEAARAEGAEGVAKTLEEQKKRFEELEKKAESMRALQDAMGDKAPAGTKEQRDKMGAGDADAQQKLAEALSKALSQMSKEDREALAKKLAEELQKDAAKQNGGELSAEQKKQLEELAKKLATEEGLKELAQQMKDAANAAPPSSGADRQKSLGNASAALQSMKGQVGKPGEGEGQTGENETPGEGKGGPGSQKTPTANPKKPGGPSPKIDASSSPSRVDSKLNAGIPQPGSKTSRTDARVGETANKQGTGALGKVGEQELGGISESDVPEEYREQVGRYFHP